MIRSSGYSRNYFRDRVRLLLRGLPGAKVTLARLSSIPSPTGVYVQFQNREEAFDGQDLLEADGLAVQWHYEQAEGELLMVMGCGR
jgi:hypothetical protein